MHSRIRRMVGIGAVAAGLVLLGACSGSRDANAPITGGPGASVSAGSGGSDGSAGSTDGPPAAGAAGKACGLVTAAEAATALGVSGDLKAKTDAPEECEYEDPNGLDSVAVTIEKEDYQPGTEDLVIDMLGKDKTKKETGLGDAAFSFDAVFQVQFHVWSKGKYLFVVVSKVSAANGGAGNLAGPARTLTEKALSRL